MGEEIYMCKEKYINVFIITDGGHNTTRCDPYEVLEKMRSAGGKIVNAFVLGCRSNFPSKYATCIKSQIHSGTHNLPYLFHASETYGENGVVRRCEDISKWLEG